MKKIIFAVISLFLYSSAHALDPNGKALYQANCASCHGATGAGGVGPKLAGDSSNWPEKIFVRATLTGVDDKGRAMKALMPHWQDASFTSDAGAHPTAVEVIAIQSYLKTLK